MKVPRIAINHDLLDVVTRMIEFGCRSPEERREIVSALAGRYAQETPVSHPVPQPEAPLPTYAESILDLPGFADRMPPKWQGRSDRSENPQAYIGREYSPWLGKGLTQAHLRQYDRPLYHALANWLSRSGKKLPADFGLPSRKELTDQILERTEADEQTLMAASRWCNRMRARSRRAQSAEQGSER